MKKRLGEILIERGLIDVDQLNSALSHQRQWGMRLGTALVAKGFVAEGMLTRVLSESLGFPMVDLSRIVVDPKALQLVSRRMCEQHDVLPLGMKEQHGRKLLFLAMADPLNATVIDEIAFTTGAIVKPAIAQISSLEQAIRRYYLGQRVEIAPLNFEARHKATAFVTDEPMTIVGTGGTGERVVVGRQTLDTALIQLDEEADIPVDAVMPLAPFDAPALPPDYLGQRTGVFAMPSLQPGELAPPTPTTPVEVAVADADILAMTRTADHEQLEALERKFWALMRSLARRGLITKEEFLAELRATEE
jgi:hypothetical protein